MRILMIEDDADVRESLSRGLTAQRHAVLTAESGSQGLGLSMTEQIDMIILDLGLPDLDGLDVLKMIRTVSTVPVLVATGREAETQVVRALELGADDYLRKPFSVAVLEARMAAIARRCRQPVSDDPMVRVGDLVLDLEGHVATLNGRTLPLRPKEFRLLAYLAANAGRVVSRQELRSEVWDGDFTSGEATVAVHLSWLRRHLGETAASPRYLHTVRGVGVRLSPP